MSVAHNIYIHVPFCMSKCNYCAFFSRACANPDWESYTSGILSEIDYWATHLGRIDVPTIFFGGGTPSLIPIEYFNKIISRLGAAFNILPDAEITLESNPGTISPEKLDNFIANGVNRLSIGVQSLNDDELKFLGRRHSAHDATHLIDAAHKRNIRVSADFIYGLPGHNAGTVDKLCRDINAIGLTHCSMYELTIEPDTPFGKTNLQMPTNDEMADMYQTITRSLSLPRYEVSNYAAPGCECRHNQNIWDGDAYIGIGNAAVGRVLVNDAWYEQYGGEIKTEKMSTSTRAMEKLIMGMRTMRGALITDDISGILNTEYLKSHNDLITVNNNRIRATERGIMVLDDLMVNLIK